MAEGVPKYKPRKRRGHMRFICLQCGFTVHVSKGVEYKGANHALGEAGWRIETRGQADKKTWGPVCNICATPDYLLPPMPIPSGKFAEMMESHRKIHGK